MADEFDDIEADIRAAFAGELPEGARPALRRAQGEALGGAQGEAPGGARGEAPGGARGEAPGGARGEAPGGAQGEAPGGAGAGPAGSAPGDVRSGVSSDTGGLASGEARRAMLTPDPDDSNSPHPEPVEGRGERTASAATDQPTAAAADPQSPRPPATWSPAAKAKFAALDPEVQAEVVRRERDMDRGLQDRASQLKRYEPLEQVIAPLRDRLSIAGVSEAQYFGALAAADQALRDPARREAALAQLARQYGVALPSSQQPQGTPDQGVHPMLAQLQTQISTLINSQQQAQQQARAQATAQINSTIDAFSGDPANLYFENVRPRMAALLSSGQAADLKDAYEQACWSDPTVRPLVLADQAKANAASAQATAGAKAQAARQASGSIVGAPGAGGSPTSKASNPNSSIEDDVRDAFASARA